MKREFLALLLCVFTVCGMSARTLTSAEGASSVSAAPSTQVAPDGDDDPVVDVPEILAAFPGGEAALLQWLSQNIKYPQKALEKKAEGRVMARFVIEKDGSVGDVSVLVSPDADLSLEAIRVLKAMPKWTPARMGARNVRSYFTLPLTFRLPQQAPAEKEDGEVYESVEVNASFPGGAQALYTYLAQNLKYPTEAQEQGIQGRVLTKFVVETDGSISNIEVASSPGASLSNEAIRLIQSMPKWTPATQGGKKVRCRFNLPVMFRLN